VRVALVSAGVYFTGHCNIGLSFFLRANAAWR